MVEGKLQAEVQINICFQVNSVIHIPYQKVTTITAEVSLSYSTLFDT